MPNHTRLVAQLTHTIAIASAFGITTFAQVAAVHKAGDIVIEKATMLSPKGQVIDFELGTIYVPENRNEPASRIIGVGFARVRSLGPTGAPPLFHLPGGPGGSFLDGLKPGDNGKNSLAAFADLFRPVADVVFIDQRGASERGEILRFKHHTITYPLDQPADLKRATREFVDLTKNAVKYFEQKGVDLRGYDVRECAEDVNDLRKALGYSKITLVGQSFGSQWSFALMRLHPEIVARALLSGVEPLDFAYDMPSHVLAATQRMWWEAEKDSSIKAYLPPGGLMQVIHELIQRFDRGPIPVELRDSQTGKKTTVVLGVEDLRKEFPLELKGPAFLISLYYEHYDEWARKVLNERIGKEVDEKVIGPLIDTSLGVTPRREYLLRHDVAAEIVGEWDFDGYLATADLWPSPDVGDEFRTEISTNVPVVFVTGDWDTMTPMENTCYVAPYFPNGRILFVEHGRHTALKKMIDESPETFNSLLEFLKTGSVQQIPFRMSLPVPKFELPKFPVPVKNTSGG